MRRSGKPFEDRRKIITLSAACQVQFDGPLTTFGNLGWRPTRCLGGASQASGTPVYGTVGTFFFLLEKWHSVL